MPGLAVEVLDLPVARDVDLRGRRGLPAVERHDPHRPRLPFSPEIVTSVGFGVLTRSDSRIDPRSAVCCPSPDAPLADGVEERALTLPFGAQREDRELGLRLRGGGEEERRQDSRRRR